MEKVEERVRKEERGRQTSRQKEAGRQGQVKREGKKETQTDGQSRKLKNSNFSLKSELEKQLLQQKSFSGL